MIMTKTLDWHQRTFWRFVLQSNTTRMKALWFWKISNTLFDVGVWTINLSRIFNGKGVERLKECLDLISLISMAVFLFSKLELKRCLYIYIYRHTHRVWFLSGYKNPWKNPGLCFPQSSINPIVRQTPLEVHLNELGWSNSLESSLQLLARSFLLENPNNRNTYKTCCICIRNFDMKFSVTKWS